MTAAQPAPASPTADDPFFRLTSSAEWNACVGPQSSEADYVNGYIEAAMELADAVIAKRLYDKRDTLAMPILYNARHALEIALMVQQQYGVELRSDDAAVRQAFASLRALTDHVVRCGAAR